MSMLETLPLMMLGMALFRNGFLTGGWAAADYRRTARRWLPPGVLLTLLVGWLQWRDRKSVVSGKSVSVRVDLGGRRIIKKKNKLTQQHLNIINIHNNHDYLTPMITNILIHSTNISNNHIY